jgi:two-component system, OmpR family, alkaline phosphatase synthesis response regulator PhoP
MQNKRILLVEDEKNLVDLISLNLELEGFVVKVAETGTQGLNTFREQRFDLIILDNMLPEMDGVSVCQTIRLEDAEVPILFLSAKHTSQDRITGLKAGADDYLTKPFEFEELLLRISALVKRGSKQQRVEDSYSFGGNKIDFNSYNVNTHDGKVMQLSVKEIRLLKLLIESEGDVVSREKILEVVWGVDVYPSTRTIDNYILNFRKLFEKNSKQPEYIFSVRGVGYKFKS